MLTRHADILIQLVFRRPSLVTKSVSTSHYAFILPLFSWSVSCNIHTVTITTLATTSYLAINITNNKLLWPCSHLVFTPVSSDPIISGLYAGFPLEEGRPRHFLPRSSAAFVYRRKFAGHRLYLTYLLHCCKKLCKYSFC